MIKKIFDSLFSTKAAGLYTLLFAFFIGYATFVENDFGTSAAQKTIFKTTWFELLLVMFGITIVVNIFKFRMVQQRKWATLLFHLSIILIIIGAGVTRYFGTEGMMHIREGEASNEYLSRETYLNFRVMKNNKSYSFHEPITFASKGNNKFKESYQIGNSLITAEVTEVVPNPTQELEDSDKGGPVMKIVVAGASGREEYYLKYLDQKNLGGIKFNFGNTEINDGINFIKEGEKLSVKAPFIMTQMVMATQQRDTLMPGEQKDLFFKSLYSFGSSNFVIADYKTNAELKLVSGGLKLKNESTVGIMMNISVDGVTQETMVSGRQGDEGDPRVLQFGSTLVSVGYGSKTVKVPFSIGLRDFILDRYPGTDSPSSYASEVTLIDNRSALKEEKRIYMNHILDYGGYRFFQSSYDPDELGTYLSVNHDFWGTWISYIGYILLTVGLLMVFFSKNTRFQYLMKAIKDIQMEKLKSIAILLMCSLIMSSSLTAQNVAGLDKIKISKDHASLFGTALVQDHKGRFKPFNTLSGEILRKIARKENLYKQSNDQIVLGMMLYPELWERVPLINVGNHPELQKMIKSEGNLAAYANFFTPDGKYIFRDQVRKAQSMKPGDQGTLEKAIMKLDERVNICNMVFSNKMIRIFPVPGDKNNTWVSPPEIANFQSLGSQSAGLATLYPDYANAVHESILSGDWSKPDQLVTKLDQIQQELSTGVIPSPSKINLELVLNKMDVFNRLHLAYTFAALFMLIAFFVTIFKYSNKIPQLTKWAFYSMIVLFVFHTIGLAFRWYVSGHAPWSNGYESMIYISWTTLLAGLIFSRNSLGGLAATAVLSSTILLVSKLSYLDPEITPLVPVLKSYWLTIHVSLEAGSYGFLMLGAVIGMLNLVMIAFSNESNKKLLSIRIKELTMISEITLIGGLVMVSIGTYLGGVWANESWGRYWGWDAKETWALVTILVYSFILHMRFIPGLKGIFAYNAASLFGFGTVIMTYFGVNYYLSGLHSYAAGDPLPIPPAVYYTSGTLALLGFAAYLRYRKVYKDGLKL